LHSDFLSFYIAAYDLYHIGTEACTAQLYDSCTDFFQAFLDIGKNESDPKAAKLFNYSQIQNYDEINVKKTLQAAQVCGENFSPKDKLCDCPIQKLGIPLL
jgi:hypothetical protein